MRRALTAAVLLSFCANAAAELSAEIRMENRTGEDKRDWPVFLTVCRLFGGNLDLDAVNPDGFHVIDESGEEIPHMLRRIPPRFSVGNDEIAFIVPRLAAGESLTLRITNTRTKGRTAELDLVKNPNNLLPNGGFEKNARGVPAGYRQVSDKGARISYDGAVKRSGERSLLITFPVGTAATLETVTPVKFKRDGRYHFSLWARTENVAYNGYGMKGGFSVRFRPAALRGRSSLTLRGTRDWYCYSFDPGGKDDWGVPFMASRAQAVKIGRGGPAEIWKRRGEAPLVIGGFQENQPFLKGDKTGRVWLDDLLLFEQPVIAVNRREPLERLANDGFLVFARPVQMPRTGVFPHEAVRQLKAFSMRGERRQVRFGIYATRGLGDLQVAVSPLKGPGGAALAGDGLDLEMLGDFVEEYRHLARFRPGGRVEYLLGIDVPPDASPGAYEGTVTFKSGGRTLRRLFLTLEVLPLDVPAMEGCWVGGVYNVGMGMKRDDAFYECYGKARFNCLVLFDYLFSSMKGDAVDFEAAQRQVEKIVAAARVTGGIGLYREPNMSEDQPRKWYQIASGRPDFAGKYKTGTEDRFKAGYQGLARDADEYAKKHGWPQLLYMVSDEPDRREDVHPSMGWLKEALPGSVTLADAQFRDMLRTWQHYELPVFDDPIDWTGPLLYEWVKKRGRRFGFCGTGWKLEVARYQPGLMLASSGGCYWHWWHTKGPFEPRGGKVVRSHAVAAMSAGVNDLRYFLALKERIEKAKRTHKRGLALAAEKYLAGVFAFAAADHDRHLMPYNGVPCTWGHDRFYDEWRARMKECLLELR